MSDRERDKAHLLEVGTPVTIVKLRPDGSEAIRYPGSVIASPCDWVTAQAPWRQRRVDLGYLVFEPEDILLEYFSLSEPFNVFAIYTHEGTLKGWYSNVTHPSWVVDDNIYWHDLYIDVIAYPDGKLLVLDEDELAAAGVERSDPELFQLIVRARDRLIQLASDNAYPFSERLNAQ
jgi:Protein of unknown function (DUF402)